MMNKVKDLPILERSFTPLYGNQYYVLRGHPDLLFDPLFFFNFLTNRSSSLCQIGDPIISLKNHKVETPGMDLMKTEQALKGNCNSFVIETSDTSYEVALLVIRC